VYSKIRFVILGIIVLAVAGIIIYTQFISGADSLDGQSGMLYFYSDT